jgi:hypothetical protein
MRVMSDEVDDDEDSPDDDRSPVPEPSAVRRKARWQALRRAFESDSDSEPSEDEAGLAKRTRLAGQAVVAAPAGKEVYEEEEVSEEEEEDDEEEEEDDDEEDEEEEDEEEDDEEEEVAIALFPGALFPGGEDGVDRLWNDIKAASFPGGGDNLARDKMEYHMDKLVQALYDTMDVEFRQRNAAAHLAYLLGTRPVAAPDGKGTVFYRLVETGSFLWTTATPEQVETFADTARVKDAAARRAALGRACAR